MKKLIYLAIFMCSAANAQFFTGAEILRRLNSEEVAEKAVAVGYIAGVHDSQRWSIHCTPDELKLGQIVVKVKNHLEEITNLHHDAKTHIVYVLKNSWPCSKNSKTVLQ